MKIVYNPLLRLGLQYVSSGGSGNDPNAIHKADLNQIVNGSITTSLTGTRKLIDFIAPTSGQAVTPIISTVNAYVPSGSPAGDNGLRTGISTTVSDGLSVTQEVIPPFAGITGASTVASVYRLGLSYKVSTGVYDTNDLFFVYNPTQDRVGIWDVTGTRKLTWNDEVVNLTTNQTIAGNKTFTGLTTFSGNIVYTATTNSTLSGSNARVPSHTTTVTKFTNAGLTSIASINNGEVNDGHTITLSNNTGNTITIVNNYGGAGIGEAIFTGSGANVSLLNNSEIALQYNVTSGAWLTVSGGMLINGTGFVKASGTTISYDNSTYLPLNNPAYTGTLTTGTLGYADTGILASLQSSTAGYNQLVIRNTSNATNASSNLIVSNDAGTASTFFGEIGINSSAFTGAGSLNLPNATYVTATSGDLVLGTNTNNILRFVVNSGATDALQISSTTATLGLGTLVGTATTQNVFTTVATTVNAFQAGTTLSIGATSGTATIRNTTVALSGGTLTGATTQNVFNTTSTTINAFGAGTTITLGGTTATNTINFGNGATLNGSTKTINIGGTGVSGSTTAINIGSAVSGATNNIKFNLTPASDTTGDTYFRNASGFLNRLGIGTAGQVLGVSAGLPSWVNPSSAVIYKFDETFQVTDCTAQYSTANNGLFQKFTPKADITVTKIYYNLQSAGADTIRVAIFAEGSNNPTTLLVQGSETTTIATPVGLRSITVAGTALTGGTQYWIAIKCDVGATSYLARGGIYNNNIVKSGSVSGAFASSPSTFSDPTTGYLAFGI